MIAVGRLSSKLQVVVQEHNALKNCWIRFVRLCSSSSTACRASRPTLAGSSAPLFHHDQQPLDLSSWPDLNRLRSSTPLRRSCSAWPSGDRTTGLWVTRPVMCAPQNLDPALGEYIDAVTRPQGGRRALLRARAHTAIPPDQLAQIAQRTLIIWGEDDRLVPVTQAEGAAPRSTARHSRGRSLAFLRSTPAVQ